MAKTLKKRLKSFLKQIPLITVAYKIFKSIDRKHRFFPTDSLYQQIQVNLIANYRHQFNSGLKPFDSIRDAGFRCYSQYEEDGILLYVLSAIGFHNRTIVEFGCGDGSENMSTNLILNHGFKGFLFDGSRSNISNAEKFFSNKKDCLAVKPELTYAWITRNNVNQLLKEASVPKEVDVLSIDIDGNDYYIWEAIESIRPRLCVFETNDFIPGNLSLTIPYKDDFYVWSQKESLHDFKSCSLLAMKKLSATKGYRLIGSHRHGFNVFFLRNDIAMNLFKELSIEEIHCNPWTIEGQKNRWPKVEHLPWIHV